VDVAIVKARPLYSLLLLCAMSCFSPYPLTQAMVAEEPDVVQRCVKRLWRLLLSDDAVAGRTLLAGVSFLMWLLTTCDHAQLKCVALLQGRDPPYMVHVLEVAVCSLSGPWGGSGSGVVWGGMKERHVSIPVPAPGCHLLCIASVTPCCPWSALSRQCMWEAGAKFIILGAAKRLCLTGVSYGVDPAKVDTKAADRARGGGSAVSAPTLPTTLPTCAVCVRCLRSGTQGGS
jgi:hypothetical protein